MTKSEILDQLGERLTELVSEARVDMERKLKQFVDPMLDAHDERAREQALADHECDHEDCKDAEEAAADLEAAEHGGDAALDLLEDLGVDRHELACLTGRAEGMGLGHCREDVLRHVLRLPAFRERVLQLAEKILNEEEDARCR